MKRVRVFLGERSYDILIGRSLLKDVGRILKELDIGEDAIVITNKRLAGLYKKALEGTLKKSGFSVEFELVPDSEKAKSTDVANKLINKIGAYDKDRDIFIIAFGGGVIGDLAGFVAALYKRGVPFVQIPTTLLAQVDSAIGGKVAVDLPVAKNLAGTFYQPRIVVSDISLLKTLPPRQIRNGLAEIIKYGVIKDRALFGFLENNYRSLLKLDQRALEHVISKSSRIKARLVSRDELDRSGIRMILNCGHTIGHAIEAASGYSNRYNHGEAISVGMIIAAKIAFRMGLAKYVIVQRIESLIKRAGLPTTIKGLSLTGIQDAYRHDKKFIRKKNRFVLPVNIGRANVVENVPEFIIEYVLREQAFGRQ